MHSFIRVTCAVLVFTLASGCAGIKVVRPGEPNRNAGTKALDWSGGTPKLVSTYSCKLDSMGHHFEAVGNSEAEARKEVVARCHDKALLTFCKEDQAKCVPN